MNPADALAGLWQLAGLPGPALGFARLTGQDPVLPSSFAVGTAAQASIAAGALAACEVGHARGAGRQQVSVAMDHAALECTGWFSIDGRVPELWDPFSGLYRCADGWVRIHANFAHHREGALRLLGLNPATASRADAEQAMLRWQAVDFETAAAERALVATALRSFDAWDATQQGQAVARQPLFSIERLGDAPPLGLPRLGPQQRPLDGVRVLDLTRILAGPVGGRALAACGADVMLVNSPHLPNIEAIADTSRGKRSTHVDLRRPAGRAALDSLLQDAHVFVQGYRPGGLEALGYGPVELARRRPGLVSVSLTAYGNSGPWAGRRGFDSLLQTAMGFNHAEGQAAGDGQPLACAGLIGANRAVAAQPGTGGPGLGGDPPVAQALCGNGGFGLWRTGGRAPQRPAVTHARGLCPALPTAGLLAATLVTCGDRPSTLSDNQAVRWTACGQSLGLPVFRARRSKITSFQHPVSGEADHETQTRSSLRPGAVLGQCHGRLLHGL